jgi:hypothetical protein
LRSRTHVEVEHDDGIGQQVPRTIACMAVPPSTIALADARWPCAIAAMGSMHASTCRAGRRQDTGRTLVSPLSCWRHGVHAARRRPHISAQTTATITSASRGALCRNATPVEPSSGLAQTSGTRAERNAPESAELIRAHPVPARCRCQTPRPNQMQMQHPLPACSQGCKTLTRQRLDPRHRQERLRPGHHVRSSYVQGVTGGTFSTAGGTSTVLKSAGLTISRYSMSGE